MEIDRIAWDSPECADIQLVDLGLCFENLFSVF